MNVKPLVVKIRTLSLGPDDILVLTIPASTPLKDRDGFSQAIHTAFPNLLLMVLPDDVKLSVIKQESESSEVARLQQEIDVSDEIIKARQQLLDVIPPCPVHGNDCVPHAIEWVEKAKAGTNHD